MVDQSGAPTPHDNAALADIYRLLGNAMGSGDPVPYDGHLAGPGSAASQTTNPFFDQVCALPGTNARRGQWQPIQVGLHDGTPYHRDTYVTRYAWSIPAPQTLAWVVEHLEGRPLIDFGAGLGYWSWQLRQLDVDVLALDPLTPTENPWAQRDNTWTHVEHAGAEALAAATSAGHQSAMLLNWMPSLDGAGAAALDAFAGDLVLHVGESQGGCTGDPSLYESLAADWELVARGPLMSWHMIFDNLELYRRRR